jgi:CO/xanthine dehydrogenase Mo-binding subunit
VSGFAGRVEDAALVAGAGSFTADLRVPGCLDLAFVRSPVAHGRLGEVATGAARDLPGVAGAWSAAELPGLPSSPVPPQATPAGELPWPGLAVGKVRYAGQPVAVVAAADRYLAEDAADLVEVAIEPLPALLDPVAAAADHAVALFDSHPNVVAVEEAGAPVDPAVFAGAAAVAEATFRQQLISHVSIEARAILVVPGEGGLSVWCSHQAPHRLRDGLAARLGLDPARVVVRVPDVGGAFGGKSQGWPEYVVAAHLALLLGRPVRWIEDRAEALTAAAHGRGQVQRVRLAADADGRLLALEARIDADVGGYPHTGSFIPALSARMLTGCYRIPALHGVVRAVLTTTPPTAALRGAGRPEAAYLVERAMDILAGKLGLDPAELRRRNFIAPDAFPYHSPTGAVYDSGDYPAALARACELAGYDELRAEQARRRATGTGPPLGIGIACYVERSGGAPHSPEYGSVEACPDGTIVARSGSCATGQGHATTFAQIVAGCLDVDFDRVRVVEGDTAQVPQGMGSVGSRSVQVGGNALHRAGLALIELARSRAAERLEADPADLRYEGGTLLVAGAPARRVTLAELAIDGELRADDVFAPPQAFPFGAYVAAVELDPGTGAVRVVRLVAVDDLGVAISPALVEGQVTGSIVQGLGQALYELAPYDDDGRPLARSLLDYLVPTIAELPDELVLARNETRNPNVPLGTKGAGEAGCIGTPPAIVNAIADALGGGDGLDMPVTPEVVWRALRRGD